MIKFYILSYIRDNTLNSVQLWECANNLVRESNKKIWDKIEEKEIKESIDTLTSKGYDVSKN